VRAKVAAAALGLIALISVGVWVRRTSQTPGSTSASVPRDSSSPKPSAASASSVEAARKAAGQFAADRQRLGQGEWAVVRDAAILERGPLGAWDDYRVDSPIVMTDESGGRGYRMWYRGCHLAMREHSCGVGLATSSDGVVWEKSAKPVFTPDDPPVQDGLDEIAIVRTGGRYYLWYSVVADYFSGRPRATVYLAASTDGLTWRDEGRVLEGISEQTGAISHTVAHDGQVFHMWYVTRLSSGESPSLLHFTSPDGKTWAGTGGTSLNDLNRLDVVHMDRLMATPSTGGTFRALFTYENTLRAMTSPDGTTWTIETIQTDPLKRWSMPRDAIQSLSGVVDRDGLWLWMDLRSTKDAMRIGVAFRKGSGT